MTMIFRAVWRFLFAKKCRSHGRYFGVFCGGCRMRNEFERGGANA
jgi:hypothetical protein